MNAAPDTNKGDLGLLAVFAALVIALFVVVTLCGCRSSGVRIVASSSTYTNLAEINYDEYKWPVFSFISGPKVTVWVNREYGELRSVSAHGSVTNTTSALALYNSTEQKDVDLAVTFAPTNAAPVTAEQVVTDFTNALETASADSGAAR